MAKDGLLCANPPSAKNLSFILMKGKKVGAADVALAASQTLQSMWPLQGRLQMGTAFFRSFEYWEDVECSLQITELANFFQRHEPYLGYTELREYDRRKNIVVGASPEELTKLPCRCHSS